MKIKKDDYRYGSFVINNSFVSDYMPKLEGDAVKVYLYLCYLLQIEKDTSESGVRNALKLSADRLKVAVDELKRENLIFIEGNEIILRDLVEVQFQKYFYGNDFGIGAVASKEFKSEKKEQVLAEAIDVIQTKYFGGRMMRGWYDLIDRLSHKMDPDVILLLFEHCEQYCVGTLKKAYVEKVAENWISEKISNAGELSEYLGRRAVLNNLMDLVKKKMNRGAPFMDSEVAVIKKWIYDYGYGEPEISLVLDWTKFNNPTIGAFDKVLTTWYNAGLKNQQEITDFLNKKKEHTSEGISQKGDKTNKGQGNNFSQRNYDQDFFDSLIKENLSKGKNGEGKL